MIKIHLLRYFIILSEELHFGRAAERLAISQPPLSSALKALEESLGVRLLERHSKRVQLTPAGAAFQQEARRILDRLERAGETARAVAAGLQGHLQVGFTTSSIYRDVPQIIKEFNRDSPGIDITLRELASTEQLDMLLHDQLDAGFLNASTVPAMLQSVAMTTDPMVCCVPVDHSLAARSAIELTEMANEIFIMPARDITPAHYDNIIAIFNQAGIHPTIRHATRQWLATVALVSQGLGVALVPYAIRHSGLAGVRFIRIKRATINAPAGLVWHTNNHTPALKAFIACARKHLQPPVQSVLKR